MPSLADLLDPPSRPPRSGPAMSSVGPDGKRRRSRSAKALVVALAVTGVVPMVCGVLIALAPLVMLAQAGSSLPPTGPAGGFVLLAFAPILGIGMLLVLAALLAGLLVMLLGVPFLIAARVVWNERRPPDTPDPEPLRAG